VTYFPQVIGQNQAIDILTSAINLNRLAQVYLFVGPPGVGRRLTAQIFSQIILCLNKPTSEHHIIKEEALKGTHTDLHWVEPTYTHQGKIYTSQEATEAGLKRKAPPQIRLEQVRGITKFLGGCATKASRLVIVVEDVETMTDSGVNALLKPLEDPKGVTIILLAKSLESILPTLISRCQIIPFHRLSQSHMEQILKQHRPEILGQTEIMEMAQGSPGEAIALAEQLQLISEDLQNRLQQPPPNPLAAMEIAKEIDQKLDYETQLFLIDYLQHRYWYTQKQPNLVARLEKTRQQLLSYVQPRLTWECTFLNICQGVSDKT